MKIQIKFQYILKALEFFIIIYFPFKIKEKIILLNDKISIIIPTYNRGKTIIKSINSILNQTYQNLEIIVVDDFSTDNTEILLSKLNDKRIKYIRLKSNKGASFARNIGIKIATGKYISFQDSDDIYNQKKIEKQYINLIKKNSDIDFCKVRIHFNNSFQNIVPNKNQIKKIRRKKILNLLCDGNFISTQSILVKNSIIKSNLFDINFPRLQDYDLVLRIIPKYKVSFLEDVLVDLYRSKDSIGNNQKKLEQALHQLSLKKYNINCSNDSFLRSPFKYALIIP